MRAGRLSRLMRSRGAELPQGVALGVRRDVALPAEAATPSQKGCPAVTAAGKWKRMTSEEV